MANKPYENSNIAVLSNEVCKSSYELSVSEHRIIKTYLKSIKDYYNEPIDTTLPFVLTVKDYATQWELDLSQAKRELKDAVISLYRKELSLNEEEDKLDLARWVRRIRSESPWDTFYLYWDDTIVRHITQLKERFTKLDLLAIKDFNSSYSFRLYEILICSIGENSFKNPKFEVEQLMYMMQVPKSYRQYNIFKQKVLIPCIKELSEKTGKFKKLAFVEHKVKGSKKVASIEFQGCGIGNRYK